MDTSIDSVISLQSDLNLNEARHADSSNFLEMYAFIGALIS